MITAEQAREISERQIDDEIEKEVVWEYLYAMGGVIATIREKRQAISVSLSTISEDERRNKINQQVVDKFRRLGYQVSLEGYKATISWKRVDGTNIAPIISEKEEEVLLSEAARMRKRTEAAKQKFLTERPKELYYGCLSDIQKQADNKKSEISISFHGNDTLLIEEVSSLFRENGFQVLHPDGWARNRALISWGEE